MNQIPLILEQPPQLSDEAARQMLDFLYELVTAFENHYFSQLRGNSEADPSTQTDLFKELDSELPF